MSARDIAVSVFVYVVAISVGYMVFIWAPIQRYKRAAGVLASMAAVGLAYFGGVSLNVEVLACFVAVACLVAADDPNDRSI
jgi:hypothetical protein